MAFYNRFYYEVTLTSYEASCIKGSLPINIDSVEQRMQEEIDLAWQGKSPVGYWARRHTVEDAEVRREGEPLCSRLMHSSLPSVKRGAK